MSKDWYQDLVEFHQKMGDDFLTTPHIPSTLHKELRVRLIKEETKELLDAIEADDLTEVADGGVDSIVVILGTLVTYGIDIRPIWDEIHKTNMAKVGGPRRPDGKFLKPEGWKPPDVELLIAKQIYRKE